MKIKNNTKFYLLGFLSSLIITALIVFIGILYLKNWQEKKVEEYISAETDILSVDIFDISKYDYSQFKPVSLTDSKEVNLKNKRFCFINFWATWCAPCVGEMPSIKNLIDELKIRKIPIDFIFANDEKQDQQKSFIDKKKLDLNFCTYKGSLPNEFVHKSIPATFIIDNEKKCIYQINGSQNWDSKLIKEFITNLNN